MENAAPTPGTQPGDDPAGQSALPPPPHEPHEPHPGQYRTAVRDLADLRRSRTDRHVAGVTGGLARHFDVDPVIIRVLLVVLTFFGGAGLVAYVGLWVLVPEEQTEQRPLGLDDRSRTVAVMVLGALSGVVALASVAGNGLDNIWWLGPTAAFVMLVLVLSERSRKQNPQPPYGTAPYGTAPYGAPSPGAPVPGAQAPGAPSHGAPAYGAPAAPAAETSDPVASAASPEMTAPFAAYTGAGHTSPPASEPTYWTPQQRADAPYAHQPTPEATRTYPMPPPPRRTNPRKRGPILFWFTLALIAVGIGVLSLMELTGVDVANSAYPAVALGVTATMLLVGSFWGRAGGLIALGLLLTLLTVGTTSVERFETENVTHRPVLASQVADSYELRAGSFELDLRDVADPARLSGREIRIDGGAGDVRVIVPADLDVRATADVGVGESTLFGENVDGLGTSHVRGQGSGTSVGELEINIDLGVGSVVVEQENGELS